MEPQINLGQSAVYCLVTAEKQEVRDHHDDYQQGGAGERGA